MKYLPYLEQSRDVMRDFCSNFCDDRVAMQPFLFSFFAGVQARL